MSVLDDSSLLEALQSPPGVPHHSRASFASAPTRAMGTTTSSHPNAAHPLHHSRRTVSFQDEEASLPSVQGLLDRWDRTAKLESGAAASVGTQSGAIDRPEGTVWQGSLVESQLAVSTVAERSHVLAEALVDASHEASRARAAEATAVRSKEKFRDATRRAALRTLALALARVIRIWQLRCVARAFAQIRLAGMLHGGGVVTVKEAQHAVRLAKRSAAKSTRLHMVNQLAGARPGKVLRETLKQWRLWIEQTQAARRQREQVVDSLVRARTLGRLVLSWQCWQWFVRAKRSFRARLSALQARREVRYQRWAIQAFASNRLEHHGAREREQELLEHSRAAVSAAFDTHGAVKATSMMVILERLRREQVLRRFFHGWGAFLRERHVFRARASASILARRRVALQAEMFAAWRSLVRFRKTLSSLSSLRFRLMTREPFHVWSRNALRIGAAQLAQAGETRVRTLRLTRRRAMGDWFERLNAQRDLWCVSHAFRAWHVHVTRKRSHAERTQLICQVSLMRSRARRALSRWRSRAFSVRFLRQQRLVEEQQAELRDLSQRLLSSQQRLQRAQQHRETLSERLVEQDTLVRTFAAWRKAHAVEKRGAWYTATQRQHQSKRIVRAWKAASLGRRHARKLADGRFEQKQRADRERLERLAMAAFYRWSSHTKTQRHTKQAISRAVHVLDQRFGRPALLRRAVGVWRGQLHVTLERARVVGRFQHRVSSDRRAHLLRACFRRWKHWAKATHGAVRIAQRRLVRLVRRSFIGWRISSLKSRSAVSMQDHGATIRSTALEEGISVAARGAERRALLRQSWMVLQQLVLLKRTRQEASAAASRTARAWDQRLALSRWRAASAIRTLESQAAAKEDSLRSECDSKLRQVRELRSKAQLLTLVSVSTWRDLFRSRTVFSSWRQWSTTRKAARESACHRLALSHSRAEAGRIAARLSMQSISRSVQIQHQALLQQRVQQSLASGLSKLQAAVDCSALANCVATVVGEVMGQFNRTGHLGARFLDADSMSAVLWFGEPGGSLWRIQDCATRCVTARPEWDRAERALSSLRPSAEDEGESRLAVGGSRRSFHRASSLTPQSFRSMSKRSLASMQRMTSFRELATPSPLAQKRSMSRLQASGGGSMHRERTGIMSASGRFLGGLIDTVVEDEDDADSDDKLRSSDLKTPTTPVGLAVAFEDEVEEAIVAGAGSELRRLWLPLEASIIARCLGLASGAPPTVAPTVVAESTEHLTMFHPEGDAAVASAQPAVRGGDSGSDLLPTVPSGSSDALSHLVIVRADGTEASLARESFLRSWTTQSGDLASRRTLARGAPTTVASVTCVVNHPTLRPPVPLLAVQVAWQWADQSVCPPCSPALLSGGDLPRLSLRLERAAAARAEVMRTAVPLCRAVAAAAAGTYSRHDAEWEATAAEAEIQAIAQRVERETEALEQADSDAQDAHMRATEASKAVSAATQDLDKTRKDLDAARAARAAAEDRAREAVLAIAAAQQQMKEAKNNASDQIGMATAARDEAQVLADTRSAELERLEERRQALEQQLREAEALTQQKQVEFVEARSAWSDAEKLLEGELREAEAALRESRAQCAGLEDTIRELKSACEFSDSRAREAVGKAEVAHEQSLELLKSQAEGEKQVALWQERVRQVQESIERVSLERDEALSRAAESAEQTKQLRDKYQALKASAKEGSSKAEDATSKVRALEEEKARLVKELSAAKKDLSHSVTALEEAKSATTAAHGEAQKYRDKAARIRDKTRAMTSLLESAREATEARISDLEGLRRSYLQEHRSRKQAQRETTGLRQQVVALQSEVAALSAAAGAVHVARRAASRVSGV
jgi:hypothetical protein